MFGCLFVPLFVFHAFIGHPFLPVCAPAARTWSQAYMLLLSLLGGIELVVGILYMQEVKLIMFALE